MGWLATLAALGAYAVALDHLRFGTAINADCLTAKNRITHEGVALGLTGVALGFGLCALARR